MERKAYKTQRRRIRELAGRWFRPLGLLWWQIDLLFYDSRKAWKRAHRAEAVMSAIVSWPYRRATIEVNVPRLPELSDEELERCFIHECMHILVEEMRQAGNDQQAHIERVCESLAQAFQWVRGQA